MLLNKIDIENITEFSFHRDRNLSIFTYFKPVCVFLKLQ